MKNLWISLCLLAVYMLSFAVPLSGQNLVSFKYDADGKTYTGFVHVMFFTNKDKEVTPFPQCDVPQLNFFGTDRKGVKAHFSGLKWGDNSHTDHRLVIRPSSGSRLGGLSLHTPEVILQEGRGRDLKYSVTGEGEGEIRIDLKVFSQEGTQQVGSVSQDYTIFNQAVAVTQIEKQQKDKVDVIFLNTETKSASNNALVGTSGEISTPLVKTGQPVREPTVTPLEQSLNPVIPINPEDVQLVYADFNKGNNETASDHDPSLYSTNQTDVSPAVTEEEAKPIPVEKGPTAVTRTVASLPITELADPPVFSERKSEVVPTRPAMDPNAENITSGWGEVVMNLVAWPLLVFGGIWILFLLGKYLVEKQKIKRKEKQDGLERQERTQLEKIGILPKSGANGIGSPEIDLFEKLVTEGAYVELQMGKLWVDTAVSKVFIHQELLRTLNPLLESAKRTEKELTGFMLGGHQYNDATEEFLITAEKFVPFRSPEGSDSPSLADHVMAEMNEVNAEHPELAITGLLFIRPGKELNVSARDQAIFQGLFGQRYQVIMQIDPLSDNQETSVFSRSRSGRLNKSENRIPSKWLNWPSLVRQKT
ncbi:hypothetical protein N9933_00505 [bacterium]|nr:hypothetical protein [bacterium]